MGTRAGTQPSRVGFSSHQLSCFHLPLGDRLPFPLLPDRLGESLDATLWFNDKGTFECRRAPVKDAPVLGAMMKEDSELNLALLTLK